MRLMTNKKLEAHAASVRAHVLHSILNDLWGRLQQAKSVEQSVASDVTINVLEGLITDYTTALSILEPAITESRSKP